MLEIPILASRHLYTEVQINNSKDLTEHSSDTIELITQEATRQIYMCDSLNALRYFDYLKF